jgi:hypothetical protein
MKRALFASLIVLIGCTAAFSQEAGVKGRWDASIETPQGAMPLTIIIATVESEKITGTLSSQRGDLAISGTVSGNTLTFSGTFDANGQQLIITFTGKLDGDSMTGEVDFGGMGGGGWSAKRAKG